jgi:hypothetical protein
MFWRKGLNPRGIKPQKGLSDGKGIHQIPVGLVWEMEESSGWKRIEGDFGTF